jgi:hypothetical protein
LFNTFTPARISSTFSLIQFGTNQLFESITRWAIGPALSDASVVRGLLQFEKRIDEAFQRSLWKVKQSFEHQSRFAAAVLKSAAHGDLGRASV